MDIIIIGIYLVSFVAVIIEQKKRDNTTWRAYKGSVSAMIGGLLLGLVMAIWTAITSDADRATYFVNGIKVGEGSAKWLDVGATFLGTVLAVGGSLLFFSWLSAGIFAKNKSPERVPYLLAAFSLIGSIVVAIIAVIFVTDETLSHPEAISMTALSACTIISGIAGAIIAVRAKVKMNVLLMLGMAIPVAFAVVLFIVLSNGL